MHPRPVPGTARVLKTILALGLGLVLAITSVLTGATAAVAQDPEPPPIETPVPPEAPDPAVPPVPPAPGTETAPGTGGSLDINLNTGEGTSNSIVIILVLTVLSVAPSLLVMLSPFTRIVIVLSLARNALGIPSVPPNQVLVGLALFLGFFVMAPTLAEMNEVALQPLLDDQVTEQEAWDAAMVPLKAHLLEHTRQPELALFVDRATEEGAEAPATPEDVEMSALVPAYILSELQSAFIIGFVIFIPFLVIDLVISAVLMSLGMMMLPPVVVSLPFKVLLFVMVGGWTLVVETILRSFP
jgi:flagellar biosynthesis protein FliP